MLIRGGNFSFFFLEILTRNRLVMVSELRKFYFFANSDMSLELFKDYLRVKMKITPSRVSSGAVALP